MNKTILTGFLTKDCELRFAKTGTAVANFTIAVNDGFGENKQTYFFNVVLFGKQAENISDYLTKGTHIAVAGKLQTRSYEAKDGTKRYVTEVVAQEVEFLGSKKTENAETFKETEEQFKKELNYGDDMEEVDSSDIPF